MADRNKEKAKRALRRRSRVRGKLFGTAELPRLTVKKSLTGIFAQIVDDRKAVTLAALASNSKEFRAVKFKGTKTQTAEKVGEMIARSAVAKGIEAVVFDRNQQRYHGRIKALAEGARKGGLKF